MSDSYEYDVFLSHGSPDKDVVRELAQRLQNSGFRVWFDEWCVLAGDSVPDKVVEGLKKSRKLVLCMSAHAFGSEWTKREFSTLLYRDPMNLERRVIPLRLDDSSVDDSVAQFRHIDWQVGNRDNAYGELLKACRGETTAGSRVETIKPPNNLPFRSLESLFKGRNEFLDQVHRGLKRGQHVSAIVGTQALHGLGGLGKTRAAIEYAWQHTSEYTALLFAAADHPDTLDKSLADLCGPLILNLPQQTEKEQATRTAAAIAWLRNNPGWLLILDNVDDNEAATAVEVLLPKLPTGHVLITSRFGDWSGTIQRQDLLLLSPQASVEFLQERTQGKRRTEANDASTVQELAQELDGLPLALEQAAAFLVAKHESFAGYLQRWKAHEAKARTWHDPVRMQYPRSMAVTWDTSFEQLDPAGRALLNMLCWFAPDPIPTAVWQSTSGATVISAGASRLAGAAVTADTEDALAQLARYGLLQWNPDGTTFNIHRLVQEVTRQRLVQDEQIASLQDALQVVDDYLPADPSPQDVRSWPLWNTIRVHVASLIDFADQSGTMSPTTRLMNELGLLLKSKGLWPAASIGAPW